MQPADTSRTPTHVYAGLILTAWNQAVSSFMPCDPDTGLPLTDKQIKFWMKSFFLIRFKENVLALTGSSYSSRPDALSDDDLLAKYSKQARSRRTNWKGDAERNKARRAAAIEAWTQSRWGKHYLLCLEQGQPDLAPTYITAQAEQAAETGGPADIKDGTR